MSRVYKSTVLQATLLQSQCLPTSNGLKKERRRVLLHEKVVLACQNFNYHWPGHLMRRIKLQDL